MVGWSLSAKKMINIPISVMTEQKNIWFGRKKKSQNQSWFMSHNVHPRLHPLILWWAYNAGQKPWVQVRRQKLGPTFLACFCWQLKDLPLAPLPKLEGFYICSSENCSFVVPVRSLLLSRQTSDWNYKATIFAGTNVKYLYL